MQSFTRLGRISDSTPFAVFGPDPSQSRYSGVPRQTQTRRALGSDRQRQDCVRTLGWDPWDLF